MRQCFRKIRDSLPLFVTDQEAPCANYVSERAMRPSTIFRTLTHGFRSEWEARLYGSVCSVIGTGQRKGLNTFAGIRAALDQRSILNPL